MLWSPNEVLAYLKEDLGFPKAGENKPLSRMAPTELFGGFQTWPSSKEDFILIAENSEIHGPNPLVCEFYILQKGQPTLCFLITSLFLV